MISIMLLKVICNSYLSVRLFNSMGRSSKSIDVRVLRTLSSFGTAGRDGSCARACSVSEDCLSATASFCIVFARELCKLELGLAVSNLEKDFERFWLSVLSTFCALVEAIMILWVLILLY